ncbi:MAG: 30S ribosomal protein S6 [Chloroflexi bacterium]|nr:30S ribosomal protein S6 [Chloroflexota bacterium]
MRDYELVLVVSPEGGEEDFPATVDRVHDLIKERGGEVKNVDRWGRRRLAYPIERITEGYYCITQFTLDPQAVREIENSLDLAEDILRHLVVRMDEPIVIRPELDPDAPVEVPADKPTKAAAEPSSEASAEKPAEPAAEDTTETPAEPPAEVPAKNTTETPAEAPAEVPAENTTETPAEAPAEVPAEDTTETPAEAPAEAPTEEPVEKPAEKPTEAASED